MFFDPFLIIWLLSFVFSDVGSYRILDSARIGHTRATAQPENQNIERRNRICVRDCCQTAGISTY
jgi:hypothetical protein